ncbi:hypothetical protein ACVIJ6_002623 [Bradyrhizobium sp. USDA 4369]
MHAGENAVVAEIGRAGQQALIFLRHQEGEPERLRVAGIGVAADEAAIGIGVGAVDDLHQRRGHVDVGRQPVGPRRRADAGHVVADIELGRLQHAVHDGTDIRHGEIAEAGAVRRVLRVDHCLGHGESAHPIGHVAIDRRHREIAVIGRNDDVGGVGGGEPGLGGGVIVAERRRERAHRGLGDRCAEGGRVGHRRGRAHVALEGALGRLGRRVGADDIVDEIDGGGERRRGAVAEAGGAPARAVQIVDVGLEVLQRVRRVGGRCQAGRRGAAGRCAGAGHEIPGESAEAVQHAVLLAGAVVMDRLQGLRRRACIGHADHGRKVLLHDARAVGQLRIVQHQVGIGIDHVDHGRSDRRGAGIGEVHRRRGRDVAGLRGDGQQRRAQRGIFPELQIRRRRHCNGPQTNEIDAGRAAPGGDQP